MGVSPWSGHSSVQLAYSYRGGNLQDLKPELIDQRLAQAKELGRELTEAELDRSFAAIHTSTR